MKKKKATQSEKEYRTLRVAALLSRGVTRSEIIKYTSAEWGWGQDKQRLTLQLPE